MANKHVKRCSKSLVIKEMQIKNIMRYHFLLTSMALIKRKNCALIQLIHTTENINFQGMYCFF